MKIVRTLKKGAALGNERDNDGLENIEEATRALVTSDASAQK